MNLNHLENKADALRCEIAEWKRLATEALAGDCQDRLRAIEGDIDNLAPAA